MSAARRAAARGVAMVAAMVAATTGALALGAPPARACGAGGDGGDGGSSGGGGSDSSSDGSSTTVSVPACVETSDVHGHRTCSEFGAWRARRGALALELAATTAALDLGGIEATGALAHDDGTRYSYRVVGEDLGGAGARTHGLALRSLVFGRHVYGGAETGFAQVAADEVERMAVAERTELRPRVVGASTAAAVLGVRGFAGALPLSLGAELTGGVRLISVEAESVHGACVTSDRTLHAAAIVEARVRADVWLSPRLAVGAWAGSELVAGAPTAGLVVATHWRAFGGGR